MTAPMTRYVVALRSPAPLGGVCPACSQIMDESGCRLGDQVVSPDPRQTHGIARLVEVFCVGVPVGRVVACASCAANGA